MSRHVIVSKILFLFQEPTLIVLGNEACDLDSAVSAIGLAYYYHKRQSFAPKHVIPVFNIFCKELPLKTEVGYYLKKKGFDLGNIVTKDDINIVEMLQQNKLDVVLVDHHFSPYANGVVQVFDHRPFDENSNLSASVDKRIELVGSCASLIADLVLNDTAFTDHAEILDLLYGAIILDTVNFSKDADKARQLDLDMAERIEQVLNIENPLMHRSQLLQELVEARSDVSTLDSMQILYKDLKLIKNKSGTKHIAFPGFPLLVTDYIQMPNAESNLKEFASEHNLDVVILMGLKIIDGQVYRDLGVFNFKNEHLTQLIIDQLLSNNLQLERWQDIHFLNGQLYQQQNLKASRKQILPLTKIILDEF